MMVDLLPARVQELLDQAYASGLATGYQQGAAETMRSMTHLTTWANDRRLRDALAQVIRVLDHLDEDERSSDYWHGDAV
jgi:hypothetical protein